MVFNQRLFWSMTAFHHFIAVSTVHKLYYINVHISEKGGISIHVQRALAKVYLGCRLNLFLLSLHAKFRAVAILLAVELCQLHLFSYVWNRVSPVAA
eukprot:14640206-Ditylum_brightwellii.AAC.1